MNQYADFTLGTLRFMLVIIAIIFCSACGQKGGLYLPDKAEYEQSSAD